MAIIINCKPEDQGAYCVEQFGQKIYYREIFAGQVLGDYENNGSSDSDFYAIVWNTESGDFQKINYGSTRGGACGSATIDATPEILKLAENKRAQNRADYAAKIAQFQGLTAIKGRAVFIDGLKGKKAAFNGAAGVIFWTGADQYNSGALRVGVDIGGERVFIPAANVFVYQGELSAQDAADGIASVERVAHYLALGIPCYFHA